MQRIMIRKDKVSEIDLQIKALQEKKKKLEEKQSIQLAQVIKKTGASTLPPELLIGALLDAVKAFEDNKDITKKWQQAGKEFLNSDKGEGGKKSISSFRQSSETA
ncbi:MAG: hypothetical protein EBT45_06270 [Alphaproteobacteria bacterium]|nr:hypothetical protein [Alphaproteobacteria bacterium]